MKRVVLIVLGVLLLLISVPLLIGGATFTVMGAGDDPTLDGRLGRAQSSGYAVVSDTLDVNWDYPYADRFDIQLGVRNTDPDSAVFIGYASAASVDAYLSGVPHTVVYDIGDRMRSGRNTEIPGSAVPEPPGEQDFWVVQASGSGMQEIPLPSGSGSYRLVAMNADGSRVVDATFYGSITLPYLLPVGIGLLLLGLVLLALAIGLFVWGARSRPTPAPTAGPGYAPGHGPGYTTPYPGTPPQYQGGPPQYQGPQYGGPPQYQGGPPQSQVQGGQPSSPAGWYPPAGPPADHAPGTPPVPGHPAGSPVPPPGDTPADQGRPPGPPTPPGQVPPGASGPPAS